jgi:hypothetical protein
MLYRGPNIQFNSCCYIIFLFYKGPYIDCEFIPHNYNSCFQKLTATNVQVQSETNPERMSISKEVFGVWKLICLLDIFLIAINTSNLNILQLENQQES